MQLIFGEKSVLCRLVGVRKVSHPNNAINADGQKRRFALLLPAGYGERWASQQHETSS